MECENWQKSLRKSSPFRDPFTNRVHQSGQREGWKAAFEKILDKMNTNKFMDNGELRTFIEQELTNGNRDI